MTRDAWLGFQHPCCHPIRIELLSCFIVTFSHKKNHTFVWHILHCCWVYGIGQTAPYRAQINYLKDAIEDSEVLNGLLLQRRLSVGTVDAFQGQERDIIAITLTRSNPQGEIGFLSDIRRMNVGMTRARRKLLLVGDSSTLCRHPFFVELLAYVKGVGGYRTAQTLVR
ncbi:MAG: C-terminal helicase domain-containing protein [Limnohabitans sp.]